MKSTLTQRLTTGIAVIAAGFFLTLASAVNAAGLHPGKTVYSFAGPPDGQTPNGDLIVDANGVYYGTTALGGVITADCSKGCGTVYKVVDGEESVIYSFTGLSDGAVPTDGLYLDAEGSLYGVTTSGGDTNMGTVFRITPDGSKSTLHSFAGGSSDGAEPNGDLIPDAEGNLYGTTYYGGSDNCDGLGCGTVFKVTPDGQESIVHAFLGSEGTEGKFPDAGLIADADGNFLGTTYGGGGHQSYCGHDGCGTIFKVTPDGQETVIHIFEGSRSAGHTRGRLVVDGAGNFYGTARSGGTYTLGTLWKVSPDGTETVLHSFGGRSDGKAPNGDLIIDSLGNLYGTTYYDGDNLNGVVFQFTPEGQFFTLYDFPDVTYNYSSAPYGRLLIDRQGNLLGTTIYLLSSSTNFGTIFKVKN